MERGWGLAPWGRSEFLERDRKAVGEGAVSVAIEISG